MEKLSDSVRNAFWENMYSSNHDLGYYEPEYSNRHIASAISSLTAVNESQVLEVVNEAMEDPESFDSLYPEAAETLVEVIQDGLPVYLWTVGNPELQKMKVAAVQTKVAEQLTATKGEEEAKRIFNERFRVSISEKDKTHALEDIYRELQEEGISDVYLTDDKEENIKRGIEIAERLGVHVVTFVRDNSHDGGSVPAMRPHLREAKRNGVKALIADVDDAIFNETGPDGRIAKMIAKVQKSLFES
jgi:methionine salvage enolase-phosphatase E1